jgi:hypothetical protein
MIRNHKSGKWVRYNSPHYRKLLKQQEETGEKIFLKKDIRHLNKTRVRTGGGDSENERRDMEIRQTNEEIDNRCSICYSNADEYGVELVLMQPCKHAACISCLARHCKKKAEQNLLPCKCPFCNEPIEGTILPKERIILPKTILGMHITVKKYRGVGTVARAIRAINDTNTSEKFTKMDYICQQIVDSIYEQTHKHIEENKKGRYKGIQARLNKSEIKVELASRYLEIPVQFKAKKETEQRVYACADDVRNYKLEHLGVFTTKDIYADNKVLETLMLTFGELHDTGCDLMVWIPITATRGSDYSGPHVNDYSVGKQLVGDVQKMFNEAGNKGTKHIITHYPTTTSRYPIWTVTLNNFYTPPE